MWDTFSEWLASRSEPRFARYRAARLAYERYVAENRVSFDVATPADFALAARNDRLCEAEAWYLEAIALSRTQEAISDVAIGLYQLGMLRHLQGRFDDARSSLQEALRLLDSLPNSEQAARSGCFYHLGLLAFRRGNMREARRLLRRSLEIDEALGDIGGIQLGRGALHICGEMEDPNEPDDHSEPEFLPADVPDSRLPAARSEDKPQDGPSYRARKNSADPYAVPVVDAPQSTKDATDSPTAGGYFEATDNVIWLLSHSVEANDVYLRPLEEMARSLGRRIVIVRAAFGATNPDQATLPPLAHDQRLCGAILILEPQGLDDETFRYWARWCAGGVAERSDFRVFVCLYGLTEAQLEQRTDAGDEIVTFLRDTVQMTSSTTADLSKAIGGYLRQLDRIRAAETWRRISLNAEMVLGGMAAWLQAGCFLIALLGLVALAPFVEGWELNRLARSHSPLVWCAVGIAFFRLLTPWLYVVFRGERTAMLLAQDERLRRLLSWSSAFLVPAIALLAHRDGNPAWFTVGIALGFLVDLARRRQREARRALLSLHNALEAVPHPLPPGVAEAIEGSRIHPLHCPLIPADAPRVFISYARQSLWGAASAEQLYGALHGRGIEVFFDRACIGEGSSWRNSLHERLGDANVIVVLLDELTWGRQWVAAEVFTALMGMTMTGVPEIIVVRGPTSSRPGATPPLPVFAALLAAGRVSRRGGPQVMTDFGAMLTTMPAAFRLWRRTTPSVLPAPATNLLALLTLPAVTVGVLGAPVGWGAGLFAYLEYWDRFRLSSQVSSFGLFTTTCLLCGFWLGFILRLCPASLYQVKTQHPGTAGWMNFVGGLGFLSLLAVWTPLMPTLTLGWTTVLVGGGWALASQFANRIARSERTNNRLSN